MARQQARIAMLEQRAERERQEREVESRAAAEAQAKADQNQAKLATEQAEKQKLVAELEQARRAAAQASTRSAAPSSWQKNRLARRKSKRIRCAARPRWRGSAPAKSARPRRQRSRGPRRGRAHHRRGQGPRPRGVCPGWRLWGGPRGGAEPRSWPGRLGCARRQAAGLPTKSLRHQGADGADGAGSRCTGQRAPPTICAWWSYPQRARRRAHRRPRDPARRTGSRFSPG